ncbi:MAG: hypothetical protein ABIT47_03130 [Candidatus Paceibacterota bacterium]
MKTKPLIIWGAFAVLVILLLSWNRIFPAKQVPIVNDPASLPGIQTGMGPWEVETPNLLGRLKAIGLPALAAEGNVLHIHQHLDLIINGQPMIIPSHIGVNEVAGFISPLHSHDTTGIIHVESNVVRDFTLGEFFDIWGVELTADCLGGYCNTGSATMRIYSNGTLYSGSPRDLVLTAHQEIVFSYGSTTPTTIPTTYAFPAGY